VDIIFKGRHTDVQDRFRERATAKLIRIGKLDHKAIRIDVEVSAERNPRQAHRRERVELTITSRGPAIRAEAAGQDRFAALDMALAKLESRLRRVGDRRKARRGVAAPSRPGEAGAEAAPAAGPADVRPAPAAEAITTDDDVVAIEMEGDGPLVVREKFHLARPMGIDQALFEMELVGHDFFLFRDGEGGCPSVVYRRRGYQYGVIRLVEETPGARQHGTVDGQGSAADGRPAPVPAPRARRATDVAAG
jgi:ribosomal subunit interface protein